MSKLGTLPEGVDSAMFLRDGWPDACVCKVVTKDGRVGIGLHRPCHPSRVTPEEFDQFVRDTVNFLSYIGEPVQLQRRNLGFRVLGFLFVFFLFAYFLKKEIWKDVK